MDVGLSERTAFLFVRSDSRLCALPLPGVVETMRPLAIEPLADAPPFIPGVTLMRGVAAPVVDLALALGAARPAPAGRFVAVRDDRRRLAAVAVDSVAGIFALDAESLAEMPPLLTGLSRNAIQAFGRWKGGLLTVVHGAHFVSDEVWARLATFRQ